MLVQKLLRRFYRQISLNVDTPAQGLRLLLAQAGIFVTQGTTKRSHLGDLAFEHGKFLEHGVTIVLKTNKSQGISVVFECETFHTKRDFVCSFKGLPLESALPQPVWCGRCAGCRTAGRFRPAAAVKRETGACSTLCLCCPRNGKQVWMPHDATGPQKVWEGEVSGLASPDTGLMHISLEVPRGSGHRTPLVTSGLSPVLSFMFVGCGDACRPSGEIGHVSTLFPGDQRTRAACRFPFPDRACN